jgi:two-component system sensor histidine kinase PilS (NtrC family)
MSATKSSKNSELMRGLKGLTLFRVIFCFILLSSTIIIQLRKGASPLDPPILALYALISGVILLSLVYGIIISKVTNLIRFAYIQVVIDTFVISFIIFVTGGFTSIFSFLYLLTIIYSSILLFRKGSLLVAGLCAIQYGIIIDLEYYGILPALGSGRISDAFQYNVGELFYKVIITMVACFGVAFLSSLLSERERRTKRELKAMADQVKRVEKMVAIGEMAAGLAHEIKNPLASLTGSIQILREEIPPNPDHEKLMHIILREADRLNSLLGDFLMFVKPPAGKVKPIELHLVIEEAVILLTRDRSNCSRITVSKNLIPDIWVSIDPSHLRQAFWNLLLNAIESMPEEGTLHIEMETHQDKRVTVSISDTGCGMSGKQIESIFDPFYTTKPNGTGLGLSIVHRILESYGIKVEIESQEDVGTTVDLSFDRIDPPN